MEKYWVLDYKQTVTDLETGEEMLTSDWGRIGRKFRSLEDLLNYIAYTLLEKDTRSREVPLEVTAESLSIVGKRLYDKKQKPTEDLSKGVAEVKIEAKAFYIEEDDATKEDYLQMKELVKVI